MDLFSLLADARSPAQKLESAARDNDHDLLEELLASGVDPNMKIHKYGPNTAMHVAATFGNYLFIERLLEAGASADVPNESDVTPLFMAARGNHFRAMRTLLKWSSSVNGIDTLWADGSKWTQLLWMFNNDSIISTLIIATPCLDFTRRNLRQNLFEVCHLKSFYNSLRVWIQLGNTFDSQQIERLSDGVIPVMIHINIPNQPGQGFANNQGPDQNPEDIADEKEAFKNWMIAYKKTPQTLQHYCRIVVRRSFHGNANVYNGVTHLHLPTTLKHYIVSPDC